MAKKKQTPVRKKTGVLKPTKAKRESAREREARELLELFEKEAKITKASKPKKETITAPPIKYNVREVKKLRGLKKKDGTYYSESYYKKLLKKVQGKTQDEVDEVLIKLRNENPNVRYFVESKSPTLHFQTGNFIDRLKGEEKKVYISKKGRKTKRDDRAKVNNTELAKGSTITIIDFRGDELTYKNIKEANEKLAEQNQIINNIIDNLKGSTKLKKGKSLGVYVTIPEKVTSNSEREITNVTYDYFNKQVQGIEPQRFDFLLEDELENED